MKDRLLPPIDSETAPNSDNFSGSEAFAGTLSAVPVPLSKGLTLDRHLTALHEVVGAVARQTDPRLPLALIAEKARALTEAGSAAVCLLDPTRSLLDFAAVSGLDAADIVGQTVRVEDALAGHTALTGELYLSHHPEPTTAEPSDPTIAAIGLRSALVVPIFLGGRPAGALSVLNRLDDGAFSGADLFKVNLII